MNLITLNIDLQYQLVAYLYKRDCILNLHDLDASFYGVLLQIYRRDRYIPDGRPNVLKILKYDKDKVIQDTGLIEPMIETAIKDWYGSIVLRTLYKEHKPIFNSSDFINTALCVNNLQMLKYLLDDTNFDPHNNPYFETALEICNIDIIKYFIHRGCDINNVDIFTLINVVGANTTEVIKYLISLGININATSYHVYYNMIVAAATCGNLEIVKYLIDMGAKTDQSIYEQMLRNSVEEGHLNVVEYVTTIAVFDKYSLDNCLVIACSGGYLNIVKHLISYGADVNAAIHARGAIDYAISGKFYNIVDYLKSIGSRDH